MRWISWFLVCAVAAGAASCASREAEPTDESLSETNEQTFVDEQDEAIASSDGELPPAEPVPLLVPPTSPEQRANQVETGRPDPFAPLISSPIIVPTRVSMPASPQPISQPQSLTTVPVAATPPLTPVPLATAPVPVQPSAPVSNTAPAAVPAASSNPGVVVPSAPATSLVESIEVSGVVQLGNQTSVIVRVPDERSSRTAFVGDRIANGRVLLKRVDMGGGDPVVVLEQDGVEVMRSVGLLGG